MIIQAGLLGAAALFWMALRLSQPMPAWAVPAMWIGLVSVCVLPYLIGLPTQVMEEAILPACAGLAGGEWIVGIIIERKRKKADAARKAKATRTRRRRPDS